MSAFAAIAWNGFREAIRNRITLVAAGFAVVLLLSTTLVAEVTVWTFDRVLTDFGLGLMALLLVAIAVYLSCGQLPREIERRTIFLVVSRPVSRTRFVLARLAGNLLTLAALELAMTAVFVVELQALKVPLSQPALASLLGLFFELAVLSAAGFFFSAFGGQLTSALATVGLYFAGHLSADLYRLGDKSDSPVVKVVVRGLYYLLPNLEKVNFRPLAAYKIEVTSGLLLSGLGHAVAWTVLFAVLASVIFERRDFR